MELSRVSRGLGFREANRFAKRMGKVVEPAGFGDDGEDVHIGEALAQLARGRNGQDWHLAQAWLGADSFQETDTITQGHTQIDQQQLKAPAPEQFERFSQIMRDKDLVACREGLLDELEKYGVRVDDKN